MNIGVLLLKTIAVIQLWFLVL